VTVEVCLLNDPEAVGLRAASIFRDRSKIAVASKGRFSVAVSGGSTPLRLYEILGSTFRNDIPWDRTEIFWADERCVPPDHGDSNYKGVHDTLLSRIDISAANIHRIKGEMSSEEGAREYEEELKRYFANSGSSSFDLVMLGLGEDGHTASLFPGSPLLSETKRFAVPVYVEKLRSWRITLAIPVLNNSSSILFLVTGLKKAGILKEILGDSGNSQKHPAGLISPVAGGITWLIDREASSQLDIAALEESGILKDTGY
jgi:6-phosphogluconolactonase